METFSILTFGCKVNQYESQQIRQLLEDFSLRKVEPDKKPDLAVINTCCVTGSASAKCRQHIRKFIKSDPKVQVVITGCLANFKDELLNISKLQKNSPGRNIHIVNFRENLADCLINLLSVFHPVFTKTSYNRSFSGNLIKTEKTDKIKLKKHFSPDKNQNREHFTPINAFKGQTRAFLKVQNGCDSFCSYCIIPKTRPIIESKPIPMILEEAENLVQAGHKEIVITGINLGAFDQKTTKKRDWPSKINHNLTKMLEKLADTGGLQRIRISSLGPGDVSDELLDVMASHSNFMPHLHLSLQSGSDNILKRMGRNYTTSQFEQTVDNLRGKLDEPALTTDIIIGFPGESDEDFQQTLDFVNKIAFTKIHIFSFSPRKGTSAAKMQNHVRQEVIKERAKSLQQIDKEFQYRFRQKFVGKTAKVLIESKKGQTTGKSERYFDVNIQNNENRIKTNDIVEVKITKNLQKSSIGTIV